MTNTKTTISTATTVNMTPSDLDSAYTALANAIHNVGEAQENLFLATLCLSLVSQQLDLKRVLDDIEQAQRITLQVTSG